MEEDVCAECGQQLKPIHGTARERCCDKGYLSSLKPLDTDKWFTTLRKKGKYWYRNWVR